MMGKTVILKETGFKAKILDKILVTDKELSEYGPSYSRKTVLLPITKTVYLAEVEVMVPKAKRDEKGVWYEDEWDKEPKKEIRKIYPLDIKSIKD
jgi:hypothetical protein